MIGYLPSSAFLHFQVLPPHTRYPNFNMTAVSTWSFISSLVPPLLYQQDATTNKLHNHQTGLLLSTVLGQKDFDVLFIISKRLSPLIFNFLIFFFSTLHQLPSCFYFPCVLFMKTLNILSRTSFSSQLFVLLNPFGDCSPTSATSEKRISLTKTKREVRICLQAKKMLGTQQVQSCWVSFCLSQLVQVSKDNSFCVCMVFYFLFGPGAACVGITSFIPSRALLVWWWRQFFFLLPSLSLRYKINFSRLYHPDNFLFICFFFFLRSYYRHHKQFTVSTRPGRRCWWSVRRQSLTACIHRRNSGERKLGDTKQ